VVAPQRAALNNEQRNRSRQDQSLQADASKVEQRAGTSPAQQCPVREPDVREQQQPSFKLRREIPIKFQRMVDQPQSQHPTNRLTLELNGPVLFRRKENRNPKGKTPGKLPRRRHRLRMMAYMLNSAHWLEVIGRDHCLSLYSWKSRHLHHPKSTAARPPSDPPRRFCTPPHRKTGCSSHRQTHRRSAVVRVRRSTWCWPAEP
jgi:hypothetical protein